MLSSFRAWVLILFLNYVFCLTTTGAKNCSVSELNSCGAGGICVQATVGHDFGVCECDHRLNRTYQSGPCIVVPTPSSSHDFSNTTTVSAIAVGLLVPIISAVIIGVLVLLARRYEWMNRLRVQSHQLTVRSYDTVLVPNEDT